MLIFVNHQSESFEALISYFSFRYSNFVLCYHVNFLSDDGRRLCSKYDVLIIINYDLLII